MTGGERIIYLRILVSSSAVLDSCDTTETDEKECEIEPVDKELIDDIDGPSTTDEEEKEEEEEEEEEIWEIGTPADM